MSSPKLFGVKLPQTNSRKLRRELRELKQNQKATLYFLYSEFLLRANRNLDYKRVLNRSTFSAIDGRGLQWSFWRILKPGFLAQIYTSWVIRFPHLFRILYFFPALFLELCWNSILSSVCLIARLDLGKRVKNEVVLGRDFIYDLLGLAEELDWKTLIIGGSQDNNETTTEVLHRLYPKLKFDIWSKAHSSDLMRDRPANQEQISSLNADNLYDFFPDLVEAKNLVEESLPNLVLVCLGGASGKQEFFIDSIYQNEEIDFTLATGIGAALDHLGSGAKQKKAPSWLSNLGLEWLYRFFTLPYRRKRILDSIFTFLWWTTIQEFMLTSQSRKQFVNIIISNESNLLMKKGKDGLEFLLSDVRPTESIRKNCVEIRARTGLNFQLIDFDPKPTKLPPKSTAVSLNTFTENKLKFDSIESFLSIVQYPQNQNKKKPKTNLVWVSSDELETELSSCHRQYWKAYNLLTEVNGDSL